MKMKLENNRMILDEQNRMFTEICDLVQDYQKQHPNVAYCVMLQHSFSLEKQIRDEGEPLMKHYSAEAMVFLVRHHVILESGKGEGEWPGAIAEMVTVKSFFGWHRRLIVAEDYVERIMENLVEITKAYEEDSEHFYENKEESYQILEDAERIVWIE